MKLKEGGSRGKHGFPRVGSSGPEERADGDARRAAPGRRTADGQVGGVDAARAELDPHRTRLSGVARPDPDRLLRAADAAEPDGADRRARAAAADDPALRPDPDQGDREGDPGV